MERMLTREDIELSCEQRLVTMRTSLASVDSDESLLQCRYVLLDGLGVPCHLIHLSLQRVDMGRVALQRSANLLLEIIDDHKVRKERQDVLDFQKIRVLQESHGPRGM